MHRLSAAPSELSSVFPFFSSRRRRCCRCSCTAKAGVAAMVLQGGWKDVVSSLRGQEKGSNLLLAPLLPRRIHREEAPSSSLRCHHPEEWRLPLAHLLHREERWEERAVAIDGRRGRRRCAAGAGDLVQVVRGTLLPLVQKNGGRSSASGESCIDLVFCWAGEVVRRDARVLRPLPWPQRHTRIHQNSIPDSHDDMMDLDEPFDPTFSLPMGNPFGILDPSSVERAAAGFFGRGPQVKHRRDVRRMPITLIILKLDVLRAMAASGNREIQLGSGYGKKYRFKRTVT